MSPEAFENLYEFYRKERDAYPEFFRLRIHRSLSWLKKAGAEPDDLDIQFISLWISFNAAYAKDLKFHQSVADRAEFRNFINEICLFDKERQIYQLVWETYSSHIRMLLDSPYTLQAFWDFHNGLISETAWKEIALDAKTKANNALRRVEDVESILYIIFDRLYTLRNQLVHGGSTYNSSANRKQLKDACLLLSDLIPLFLKLTMANANSHDWGKPFYPYIRED